MFFNKYLEIGEISRPEIWTTGCSLAFLKSSNCSDLHVETTIKKRGNVWWRKKPNQFLHKYINRP